MRKMSAEVNKYLSKLKSYLNNHALITDLLSKLIITFAVVLIVGGLYLMIFDPSASGQSVQTNVAARSVTATTAWIPGLPFFASDIAGCSMTAVGLISWVMGVNLLLTGLGLWIRHKLARLVGLALFSISAAIQFAQFLLLGIIGSPYSIILLILNSTIAFFLFTRFDYGIIELKNNAIS